MRSSHAISRAVAAATFALMVTAFGQGAPAPPSGQKTLAATLNVYAFPSAGQAADQQSKDESECYQWAVSNTGSDPFQLQKDAEKQAQDAQAAAQQAAEAGKGSAAKGAVRGAAAGALVGGIADDEWGKGAAIGAGVGVAGGAAKGRRAQKSAESQAATQAEQIQQATQVQVDNFKKAFSACLEAKKYLVKF